jgi:hypothetical protein
MCANSFGINELRGVRWYLCHGGLAAGVLPMRKGRMLVGMICGECGATVKRVCRDCQALRARAGMLMHQRRFLQTWAVNGIDLRVRDVDGVCHLELFDDMWHGYCGHPLPLVGSPRRRVRVLPADLCSGCRTVLDELLTRYVVGDQSSSGASSVYTG